MQLRSPGRLRRVVTFVVSAIMPFKNRSGEDTLSRWERSVDLSSAETPKGVAKQAQKQQLFCHWRELETFRKMLSNILGINFRSMQPQVTQALAPWEYQMNATCSNFFTKTNKSWAREWRCRVYDCCCYLQFVLITISILNILIRYKNSLKSLKWASTSTLGTTFRDAEVMCTSSPVLIWRYRPNMCSRLQLVYGLCTIRAAVLMGKELSYGTVYR